MHTIAAPDSQPSQSAIKGGEDVNVIDQGETLNLFVANLSCDVTDAMLEAAFSPYGSILSAKVMLDIHTGVSRGFGFVLFRNKDDGNRAMAGVHGSTIGAKQVFVSVAKTTGKGGMQLTPKLYVRNVPKCLSIETLRSFFSQFGNIVRITFREDGTQAAVPQSQRSYLETTTVVFLEYATVAEAQAAVRGTHNTRPWTDLYMEVPLLAKPAETSQLRNERRQRQQQPTRQEPSGPAQPYVHLVAQADRQPIALSPIAISQSNGLPIFAMPVQMAAVPQAHSNSQGHVSPQPLQVGQSLHLGVHGQHHQTQQQQPQQQQQYQGVPLVQHEHAMLAGTQPFHGEGPFTMGQQQPYYAASNHAAGYQH